MSPPPTFLFSASWKSGELWHSDERSSKRAVFAARALELPTQLLFWWRALQFISGCYSLGSSLQGWYWLGNFNCSETRFSSFLHPLKKELCSQKFRVRNKHPEYKTWRELFKKRFLLLRQLRQITLVADLDCASRFLTISKDRLSIRHVNPSDEEDMDWVCSFIKCLAFVNANLRLQASNQRIRFKSSH